MPLQTDRILRSVHEDGEYSTAWYIQSGNYPRVIVVSPTTNVDPAAASLAFEHAFSLRDELDSGWAARPLQIVREEGKPSLIIEDPGGKLLADLLGSGWEYTRFLRSAIGLVNSLKHLHARNLIHRNLTPANILVNTDTGEAWLSGFVIATRLPGYRQEIEIPSKVVGALAYMAPEQTGRMNRSIDSRSDLYACGMIFYQMLTGDLPFRAATPIEWINCHVARPPIPPGIKRRDIPIPLASIVLKLLAKNAEDRYQTAAGLEQDLRKCLEEWSSLRMIEDFPLGVQDIPSRLLIPEKLYGREQDVASLLDAFKRVATGGRPELVNIAGYSGVGKSALAKELDRALVATGARLVMGKLEQQKQDIPYAPLVNAFQDLLRPILALNDVEMSSWRDAIQEAVGSNGQVMVDLLPDLAFIIGPQPDVPALFSQEQRNRFQMVFRRLIGVFAQPSHPLVLFIDDLQWLDEATLDLIAQLITSPEIRHLLIVGAYRDNEVDELHPLTRMLRQVALTTTRVTTISLSPLTTEHVAQLVQESLRCDPKDALSLASLIYEKTGGNPFFAIQFLRSLVEERQLVFDPAELKWIWNLSLIQERGYTDNVAELMVGKLRRLSSAARHTLATLACMGNTVPARLLSYAVPEDQEANEVITEALDAGLLLRLESVYVFPHDRVQEAAYALIPELEQAHWHLRVGKMLLRDLKEDASPQELFSVVNQLNRGSSVISTDGDEHDLLTRLNYAAGLKAKAAIAYESARKYFSQALALLGAEAWDTSYSFTFDLHLAASECEYLTGNFAKADSLFVLLLDRARSKTDKVKVFNLRINLYQVAGRYDLAMNIAIAALELFGITLPEPASEVASAIAAETKSLDEHFASRAISDVLEADVATDADAVEIINLLVAAIPCSYIGRLNLFPLIALKAVNFSLKYGNTDQSSFAYAIYALMLVSSQQQIDRGFEISTMALQLNERFDNKLLKGSLLHLHGDHIIFWKEPFPANIPILRDAFTACLNVGDLVYAGFIAFEAVWQAFERGETLSKILETSNAYAEFALNSHNDAVYQTIRIEQQFVACLRGATRDPLSFEDEAFSEKAALAAILAARFGCGEVFYHIMKQFTAYLMGDFVAAYESARSAEPVLGAAMAMPIEATYYLLLALTLCKLYATATAEQREEFRQKIEEVHRQYEVWAHHCPDNYLSRLLLLRAEIARLEGRGADAASAYEEAIKTAAKDSLLWNEALGFELAAQYYSAAGFERISSQYMRHARQCYAEWGAAGKVGQLDAQYPYLREASARPDLGATINELAADVDLESVIRVSQAVYTEIVPERLITSVLTIALQHAGADRGLLILQRGNSSTIEAEAIAVDSEIKVSLRKSIVTSSDMPLSVLQYARRTRIPVLLNDITAQEQFNSDPYIRKRSAQSILCLPLVRQSSVTAVLYLENTIAAHVFTPARVAVLNLLGAQAAISLENARLYGDLSESENRLQMTLNSIPVLAWIADAEGNVQQVNERWMVFTGLQAEELTGWGWRRVFHPEDLPLVEQGWRAMLAAGQPGDLESRIRRSDGEYRWFLIRGFPLRDKSGNVVNWYGTNTDIEDRRREEVNVLASERALRLIVESIPGLVWCATPDGTVDYVNKRILAYIGSPSIDAAPHSWMHAIHPDDAQTVENTWSEAVSRAYPCSFEFRIRRYDGVYRWFQASCEPTRNAEGRVSRWYCLLFDIDDRKRGEEALRKTQAGLMRATQLATAGELTASITHEVSQPITAVLANATSTKRWLSEEHLNLPSARKGLERIIRDAKDTAEIVRKVRSLFKRSAYVNTAVNVNEIIVEVLELIQNEAQKRKIEVHTILDHDLELGWGDRVQIQQVLLNLLINGMDAMDTIPEDQKRLRIQSEATDDRYIRVKVQDWGIGILEEDKIFESFFTTKEKGMGMGLSICRSIVETHGGRLWVESKPGHGATFFFTLPIAHTPPDKQEGEVLLDGGSV
jgi:PAS domain S-box-containing protein